jgi:hypothetical protein
MIAFEAVLASNWSFPIVTPQYTDEVVKRSNEITENIVSAVRINNQLTVNATNAAAENFRTINRTIESVTEFNTSAAKAWNSYVTVQQQQFLPKDPDGHLISLAEMAPKEEFTQIPYYHGFAPE